MDQDAIAEILQLTRQLFSAISSSRISPLTAEEYAMAKAKVDTVRHEAGGIEFVCVDGEILVGPVDLAKIDRVLLRALAANSNPNKGERHGNSSTDARIAGQ